jgi:hypothetical protein
MAGEILTDGDLTDLRAVAVEFQPDTCDIIAATYTDDGFGGQVEDWTAPTAIASDVSCSYSETLGQREEAQVSRLGLVVSAEIHVPALTPVQEGHRIVLTAAQGDHGGTYAVRGLTRSSYEAVRVALVGKIVT